MSSPINPAISHSETAGSLNLESDSGVEADDTWSYRVDPDGWNRIFESNRMTSAQYNEEVKRLSSSAPAVYDWKEPAEPPRLDIIGNGVSHKPGLQEPKVYILDTDFAIQHAKLVLEAATMLSAMHETPRTLFKIPYQVSNEIACIAQTEDDPRKDLALAARSVYDVEYRAHPPSPSSFIMRQAATETLLAQDLDQMTSNVSREDHILDCAQDMQALKLLRPTRIYIITQAPELSQSAHHLGYNVVSPSTESAQRFLKDLQVRFQ
ncbi:hypothetical protein FRB90_012812 [Tulasnella sp. 427]|nr:hypothetical protein FRB90_012812 [Tulasnella sp. 427]